MSKRELAGDDCTPAYISRLELGQRVPSIQLLRLIGKRLKVDADFLATGGTVNGHDRAVLVDAEVALRFDDSVTARRLYERALVESAPSSPGRERRSQVSAGLHSAKGPSATRSTISPIQSRPAAWM